MAIKPENQMYADIIGFINNSLTILSEWFPDSNFSEWQVLQLNQPVKLTEITPTIWVSLTNKTRRGWQFRKYKGFKEYEQLTNTQKFKQEVLVQISALRSRMLDDTTSTLNSSDVLEYLKAYMLNPVTIQNLRQLGYSIYQPTEIQKPDFYNDSDNFEFMPFFQVTFILEQSLERPQEHIDEIIIKTIEGV